MKYIITALLIAIMVTTVSADGLKHFKNNLKKIKDPIPLTILRQIDSIAQEYIKKVRKEDKDIAHLEPIFRNVNKHYKYKQIKCFLIGYAFKKTPFEKKDSASFFVIGYYKDNNLDFWDIQEDLLGEINMKLSGIINGENETTIYGETYPYFGRTYGKFSLSIIGSKRKYQYEYNDGETR